MIKDPEMETIIATGFDSGTSIAKLAYEVVSGELAGLEGNYILAIEHLKKAVVLEDGLTYNEPASWHIPTRQNLGAILMKAKKYEEAEKIYNEDLRALRQNGWSLTGLYQSLKAQGKMAEAEKIKQEFDKAWSDADIKIDASIL